jgi:hypothetical protein
MGRTTRTRFRQPPIWALLPALLLPTVASAGWGDEDWGSMVWGGPPTVDIPALPVEGIAALAGLLFGLCYWLLATRRRRAKRLPLHS